MPSSQLTLVDDVIAAYATQISIVSILCDCALCIYNIVCEEIVEKKQNKSDINIEKNVFGCVCVCVCQCLYVLKVRLTIVRSAHICIFDLYHHHLHH